MAHPPSDDATPTEHESEASAAPGDTAPAISLEPPDHLPISYLNALLYCPRRFYYEYAQGEMLVNEHVLQGRVYHRVADTGGARLADGALSMRRVYVYSDRLRIAGLIDVVEAPLDGGDFDTAPDPSASIAERASAGTIPLADAEPSSTGAAGMYPVEYKKGSAHGGRANDHVQLCAQGLCLEERVGRPIAGGYVFSFETRRRTWIPFTPELRAQTEATIAQAFALLRAGRLPPPLPAELDRKCRACSLEPLCLPREVRALGASTSSS
jgi:CRISPR-associated exonuclease Cas4